MKKIECKICRKTNIDTKLTYNTVKGDYLCLDCYRNQFTKTLMDTKPKFF